MHCHTIIRIRMTKVNIYEVTISQYHRLIHIEKDAYKI